MFRFTQEPPSGNQSHCLAKITGMVPLCLSIWTLSVLWWHIPTVMKRGGYSGTIRVILARHWL